MVKVIGPAAIAIAIAIVMSATATSAAHVAVSASVKSKCIAKAKHKKSKAKRRRAIAKCRRRARPDRPVKPAPSAPPPAPAGTTRDNPLPVGSVGTSGGWRITVLGTTPDATAAVLAENQFNDPPEPGSQFFIATVRASYVGDGSESFLGDFRLRAVGASAVEYTTFENSCGVIPNPITSNDVFPGGTIEGNVCWQVRSSDASSLVMYDEPPADDTRMFFALG